MNEAAIRWDLTEVTRRVEKLEQNGIPGVRDFFATSALSCLATQKTVEWYQPKEIATYCYKIADAMMAEREKKNNE